MAIGIKIKEGYESQWIEQMIALYNKTELKRSSAERVNSAFQKNFAVVSCWENDRMIGIGRMISDEEMYSGIFDVVVDPDFQKQNIGKKIMQKLISKAPHTSIHLTSTFGNENFYLKLGFK